MSTTQPLTVVSPKPEPESLTSVSSGARYDDNTHGYNIAPNHSPPPLHNSSHHATSAIPGHAIPAPKTPDFYQNPPLPQHQKQDLQNTEETYTINYGYSNPAAHGVPEATRASDIPSSHPQEESQSQFQSQSQFYAPTTQAYGPPPPNPQYGAGPLPPANPYGAPYYPSATWIPYPGPPAMSLQPQPQPSLTRAGNLFVDELFNIADLRRNGRESLKEYMTLVTEATKVDAYRYDGALMQRMVDNRAQAISILATLRQHLTEVTRSSEKCRFRSWLTGLVAGSIIPVIKSVFRRLAKNYPHLEAANDTEYAFKRSRTLTDYLKSSVFVKKRLASVSMFLFAVLFVFQNEILLRVSRTMYKRVRRLHDKVIRGQHMITEEDLSVMDGWRWRVIAWAA